MHSLEEQAAGKERQRQLKKEAGKKGQEAGAGGRKVNANLHSLVRVSSRKEAAAAVKKGAEEKGSMQESKYQME